MYEELVKRLRTATTLPFMNALCQDAADAIEELSLEIDMDNAALTEIEAAITRWIPVTERLPEEDKLVLVWRNNGLPYVSRRIDLSYWVGLGRDAGVTHWMPLPQPPKEA